jgi:antitoxin HicB
VDTVAAEDRINQLLGRPYRKVIRGDADEGFLAEVPELPGCVTAGDTETEALANLKEAMAAWFEDALAEGEAIPEPSPVRSSRFSGRVLLRMPATLHRQLAERAQQEGVSLNQLAVVVLAKGLR